MTKNTNIILPNWKDIAKVLKYKEKNFSNLLENYIKAKKEIYTNIKSIKKENRNFENTVLAIENSGNDFTDTIYQIGVYSITHKDKAYRDMADNFQKEMSEKMTDIEYDKDIYLAFMDYYNGNYKKEKKNLDKIYGEGSAKLVEDEYKGYKRMGFELPKVKQDKLKNNIKALSKLSLDFGKNIYEYKDFILCNEEEIKGLSDNFIKTLLKENGKYKITLDYPSMGPFLQYADNREKRKELMDKNYQKGGKENLKILAQIVKLRNEKAKILGFKNFVDFNLENRMAKNENNTRKFVEGLIKKLEPISKKEFSDLNTFAKNNLEQYKDVKKIDYYDISYVATKYKENKYVYDTSKIKEYFELENILKTTFDIFGELFNFKASEIKDKEIDKIKADKSLRVFEFKDKSSRQIISYFILDLFPRDGKYDHACSAEFIIGGEKENQRIIPINEIICNFSKATKNLPSLLTLGEVNTFFHELGHALHYMFTSAKYGSQAGYNVVFDFVETPSQMLENFLFNENNLKKLAIHYKTKKVLDKDIINKIINSKNFLNGSNYLRQNIMNLFDLDLHSNKIKPENSAKHYISLIKKYQDFDLTKENIFPAGFGHLMGYAAGYYSYMWALVYADDFYSVFKEAGNDKKKLKEIGGRYRKEILEVGGSRDENISVQKFLGRNSNNKAFLENLI